MAQQITIDTLIDSMPDFVFWKDRSGAFQGCSQAFAECCFGCSKEQIIGKTERDLLSDPSMAQALHQEDLAVMETAELRQVEFWFTMPDGERRCFDTRKIPLFHATGEVYGLLVAARDITESKKLYDALLSSEERLNRAQRIARLGCWDFDHTTGRLDWSDEVYRIFELDQATFVPSYQAFFDVIHPDDGKTVHETYQQSLQARTPFSTSHRLLLSGGRIKQVFQQCETSFDSDGIPIRSIGTVQDITEFKVLQDELAKVLELEQEQNSFHTLVTANPTMKSVLILARQVTKARQTTLALYGESGTGKEVLAKAIHLESGGLPGNFVAVNCAAIPAQLLESELFGHERGAFTGAHQRREGKCAAAKGGTLLLDEIGDMPLALQAKLLRILETRTFERVGSNQPLPLDCRVIVVTNKDLSHMVVEGRFREDLFHRINIFPLCIPPLRERSEDIPLLCTTLLQNLQQQLGPQLHGISQQAMDILYNYSWPGNIRELRNCLERAAIVCNGGMIRPEHLVIFQPAQKEQLLSQPDSDTVTYTVTIPTQELSLETLSSRIMSITLDRCNGNKTLAAKLLKIGRTSYYRI